MRAIAEEVSPYEPYITCDHEESAALDTHPAFGHIRFHRRNRWFPKRAVLEDAHLAPSVSPTQSPVYHNPSPWPLREEEDYQGLLLRDHPLIARSFATFAPTAMMDVVPLAGDNFEFRDWPRAVTVLDIISKIHAS